MKNYTMVFLLIIVAGATYYVYTSTGLLLWMSVTIVLIWRAWYLCLERKKWGLLLSLMLGIFSTILPLFVVVAFHYVENVVERKGHFTEELVQPSIWFAVDEKNKNLEVRLGAYSGGGCDPAVDKSSKIKTHVISKEATVTIDMEDIKTKIYRDTRSTAGICPPYIASPADKPFGFKTIFLPLEDVRAESEGKDIVFFYGGQKSVFRVQSQTGRAGEVLFVEYHSINIAHSVIHSDFYEKRGEFFFMNPEKFVAVGVPSEEYENMYYSMIESDGIEHWRGVRDVLEKKGFVSFEREYGTLLEKLNFPNFTFSKSYGKFALIFVPAFSSWAEGTSTLGVLNKEHKETRVVISKVQKNIFLR